MKWMFAILASFLVLVGCGNDKEQHARSYEIYTKDISVGTECGPRNSACWTTISFLGSDGVPINARLEDVKYILEDGQPYYITYEYRYNSAVGNYTTAHLNALRTDYDSSGRKDRKFFKSR